MAEQVKLTDPSILTTDEPSGGILYIVKDGVDYSISYEDLLKYAVKYAELSGLVSAIENKRAGRATLTAEVNNTITFEIGGSSTPFDPGSDYSLQITDLVGLGLELISRDENGFVVKPLVSGTIEYTATLIT